MQILLPEGWPRAKGYSNGIAAEGRMVFVSGQLGWDTRGRFAQGFAGQLRQTLQNTIAVLEQAGAGPEHVVRMTWFVRSIDDYTSALKEVGAAYREVMGRHYPTMSVVEVSRLVEPEARLEIESTAVLPRE